MLARCLASRTAVTPSSSWGLASSAVLRHGLISLSTATAASSNSTSRPTSTTGLACRPTGTYLSLSGAGNGTSCCRRSVGRATCRASINSSSYGATSLPIAALQKGISRIRTSLASATGSGGDLATNSGRAICGSLSSGSRLGREGASGASATSVLSYGVAGFAAGRPNLTALAGTGL